MPLPAALGKVEGHGRGAQRGRAPPRELQSGTVQNTRNMTGGAEVRGSAGTEGPGRDVPLAFQNEIVLSSSFPTYGRKLVLNNLLFRQMTKVTSSVPGSPKPSFPVLFALFTGIYFKLLKACLHSAPGMQFKVVSHVSGKAGFKNPPTLPHLLHFLTTFHLFMLLFSL